MQTLDSERPWCLPASMYRLKRVFDQSRAYVKIHSHWCKNLFSLSIPLSLSIDFSAFWHVYHELLKSLRPAWLQENSQVWRVLITKSFLPLSFYSASFILFFPLVSLFLSEHTYSLSITIQSSQDIFTSYSIIAAKSVLLNWWVKSSSIIYIWLIIVFINILIWPKLQIFFLQMNLSLGKN